MHIRIICDDVFRTKIVINSAYIFFKKSHFYYCYSAKFLLH
jgi:hypothetical protein